MARRPDSAEFDRPLNRAELAEHHRRLAILSPYHLMKAYQDAYEACKIEDDQFPSARAVQELVTAWKLMWTRKRKRSFDRR
jgi:hypothetical protein